MRRHPTVEKRQPIAPAANLGPLRPPPATDQGEVITPFLSSGGMVHFVISSEPPFQPQADGVQLVTSVYVPRGRTGFLKELRVAPFMPPPLVDPWETSGIGPGGTGSWRTFDNVLSDVLKPGGRNCVWEVPFGWESYFDAADPQAVIPQWVWQLTMIPGTLEDNRQGLGPFAFADPSTWYLVPNVAVPATAYPNGIPGEPPSGSWGPQRMQVIQGDKLSTHVVVPERHTLCLFARWTQALFQPRAMVNDGETETIYTYGDPLYPLLPSFGQLHGYMQAVSSEQAIENSQHGWGG